jgi:hypothetical protein
MNRRISRCSLGIVAAMLLASLFLKQPDGALGAWYGAMTIGGLIPLALGPRMFRWLGACAAGFSCYMLLSDYEAGKSEQTCNDQLLAVAEQVKSVATGEQWNAWAAQAVERWATNGVRFPEIGLQRNEMPEFACRVGVPGVIATGNDADKTPVVLLVSGECLAVVGPSNYVDTCTGGVTGACRRVYPGVYVHGLMEPWAYGDIQRHWATSPPSLKVDASGTNLLIGWVRNFELEQNFRAGGTDWSTFPKMPAFTYESLQFQMAVPLPSEATYYRLRCRSNP